MADQIKLKSGNCVTIIETLMECVSDSLSETFFKLRNLETKFTYT